MVARHGFSIRTSRRLVERGDAARKSQKVGLARASIGLTSEDQCRNLSKRRGALDGQTWGLGRSNFDSLQVG